jgi:acyl dehydratase
MELRTVTKATKIPPLIKRMTDHQRAVYDQLLFMAREMSPEFSDYLDGANIHTDDAMAQKAGFPSRIAPGVQTYSFLMEMLSLFFGESWLKSGKIRVKFIYPLLIGEEIRCEGEIAEIVGDKKNEGIAKLDLRCKNSQGKLISVGSAEVRVKLANND